MDDWPGQSGGGGAFLLCNVVLEQCVFVGNILTKANTNYTGGGGLYLVGGTALVKNSKFIDNYSNRYGGAIWGDGTINLIDSTFIKNSSHEGGAIHINNGDALITNCFFIENVASRGGAFNQYSFDNIGTSFFDCTFSKNSALATGGAIYGMVNGKVKITNCILWGDTASDGNEIGFSDSGGTILVDYSNVEGGETGVYLGGGTVEWGTGNIDIDPCFADVDANDFHLKSQAGRWHPNSESWVQDANTSPCIDAGDPNNPIGLEPFPNGGRVNMGAYGGTIEASKSYFGGPICEIIVAGDINGDCKVDGKDLAIMALHWLEDNNP